MNFHNIHALKESCLVISRGGEVSPRGPLPGEEHPAGAMRRVQSKELLARAHLGYLRAPSSNRGNFSCPFFTSLNYISRLTKASRLRNVPLSRLTRAYTIVPCFLPISVAGILFAGMATRRRTTKGHALNKERERESRYRRWLRSDVCTCSYMKVILRRIKKQNDSRIDAFGDCRSKNTLGRVDLQKCVEVNPLIWDYGASLRASFPNGRQINDSAYLISVGIRSPICSDLSCCSWPWPQSALRPSPCRRPPPAPSPSPRTASSTAQTSSSTTLTPSR